MLKAAPSTKVESKDGTGLLDIKQVMKRKDSFRAYNNMLTPTKQVIHKVISEEKENNAVKCFDEKENKSFRYTKK